jgi:hypothetical protein
VTEALPSPAAAAPPAEKPPRGRICGLKLSPLHPRTPRLADHVALAAAAGAPLVERGFFRSVADWPYCLNDRLGTCPIAGVAHALQLWGAVAGRERIMRDPAVLQTYIDVGGYDPTNPATDRGLVLGDLLEYWRTKGVEIGDGGERDRLDAYASVDPRNLDHLAAAIDLCGAVLMGFSLPRSAMTQAVLEVPAGGPVGDGAPGSEGGHLMLAVGHGPLWTMVTWGRLQMCTREFILAYAFQAVVPISRAWLTAAGTTLSGETLDRLEVAAAAISAPAVSAASA